MKNKAIVTSCKILKLEVTKDKFPGMKYKFENRNLMNNKQCGMKNKLEKQGRDEKQDAGMKYKEKNHPKKRFFSKKS